MSHKPHVYVELSFDVTDPDAFAAWVMTNLPPALIDPTELTEGALLAAAMRAVDAIPGIECYGGGAHRDYEDRRDVVGRVPVFHRHVNEHAHPSGGVPHMHQTVHGVRTTGRHYFGPDDVLPDRALEEAMIEPGDTGIIF